MSTYSVSTDLSIAQISSYEQGCNINILKTIRITYFLTNGKFGVNFSTFNVKTIAI